MFINEDTANDRLEQEDNLVNMILSISNPSSPSSLRSEVESNFEQEKESDEPLAEKTAIVKAHHSGRRIGTKNSSIELHHAAGLLAQSDTIANVANALGLDKNSVAQNKHGRTVHNKENPELKDRLERDLAHVRDKAMDRLLMSLDLLDDDKIGKASAKDISSISSSMAKVMQSTLPKDSNNRLQAQLIVYAPSFVNRQEYEVIEVGPSR